MRAVVILSLISLVSASDYLCTSIGGTCQDYTKNICPAGYLTGKCDGGANRRCCKPCNSICQSTEEGYLQNDEACHTMGGKCLHNSNYCLGTYHTGKCDGPSARRCCVGVTAGDAACTSIGGSCQDYTKNICIAGYVTGKCTGDSNRRCCLGCNSVCRLNEASNAQNDGSCTSSDGTCKHNSNHCSGSYVSGKCGGPSERQCCQNTGGGGSTSCHGTVLDVETTGASQDTANQDRLTYSGVRASFKLAENDGNAMNKYKTTIQAVAEKYCIEAAVIAGIISRETRAGKVLRNDGFGYDGHGFGLMQVDDRFHELASGDAFSQAHIEQGTRILIGMIEGVKRKHPGWSQRMIYKGGMSAYNAGVGNVWSYERMDIGTTGNDYGNDVAARAQYYKDNGY